VSDTDRCARCGGDCPMTNCLVCGGCENAGTQPCPACQPVAGDREMPPCDICEYERDECGNCEGSGDDGSSWGCMTCGGSGEVTPEHCCACGGSPYCTCCSRCGASCIGECKCPVMVQLADGGTLTLEGADGEGQ
jgi:hypothetical protein